METVTVTSNGHQYQCMVDDHYGRIAFHLHDGSLFDSSDSIMRRIMTDTVEPKESTRANEIMNVINGLIEEHPTIEIGIPEPDDQDSTESDADAFLAEGAMRPEEQAQAIKKIRESSRYHGPRYLIGSEWN